MRSYRKSWKSLGNHSFLRHTYKSGIAFYVFPGCPIIDMVVPLRITNGSANTEFIPMFVSIKCQANFSDQKMADACEEMKSRAEKKLKKAFCLLISFGSNNKADADPNADSDTDTDTDPMTKRMAIARGKADSKPNAKQSANSGGKAKRQPKTNQKATTGEKKVKPRADFVNYKLVEGEQISELLSGGGILARAIRVPLKDAFGLTNAFKQMTPAAEIDAELFSSHTYLKAHGNDDDDKDLDGVVALRQGSYSKYGEDYELLRRAMTGKTSEA